MFTWVKRTLYRYFSKSEIELSRQIHYAQSVLDSSSYPSDIKNAVSAIDVSKRKKLKRIQRFKELCSS